MGVITYLFHRSEALTAQRFNIFFLDVGENIHVHYRDLRIELSTDEFEELAAGFERYAPSVLKLIREEGYRDGVLPNTNTHETVKTFWDKSKLVHPVKYNERRLSIEDNVDGFHIHFRNYKLLLDRASFEEFAHGMATALLQLNRRTSVDPVDMLALNDLAPHPISTTRQGDLEETTVAIAPAYRVKAEQTLAGLGYTLQGAKADGLYVKQDRRVRLVTPVSTEAVGRPPPTAPVPLPDFIEHHAAGLDAVRLNELKLRLLYLYKRAQSGHLPAFRMEDVRIDPVSHTPSVDVFQAPEGLDPVAEYNRLSALLTRKKLFFIKPDKRLYTAEQRAVLNAELERHVADVIARHPCVQRVYLLGSSTRDRSGEYLAPFVHFDWVKLASDYDLLIEIEPDYETDLPPEWERKFDWPHNTCVYSHLGDLGQGMDSAMAKRYPGVRFFEHMLETYLYLPSRSNRAIKDDFLQRIQARLLFERPGFIDWFEAHYPARIAQVKRIKAASFNKLYDIASDQGRFALKVYQSRNALDSGSPPLAYELAVTASAVRLGLPTPPPIPSKDGDLVTDHPDGKAVLFQFVEGKYRHQPSPEEARQAGQLLARIHLYSDQVDIPAGVTPPRIAQTLLYWLKAYPAYVAQGCLPERADLPALIDAVHRLDRHLVHCHGDVSPRNFLYRDDGCWLIDFQNAGLGPAMMELADGMIEFSARSPQFDPDAMTGFLDGYRDLLPLDGQDLADLAALLPAQAVAKQARLARAHDHGFEWNADLQTALQRACAHALTGKF